MLVRTVQHLNVTFLGDAIFLPTRIKWFAGKSSSLLCVTRIPCHHTPTGFPKAKATSQVQDDPRPSHSTPRKFSFRELLDDRLAHRPHSLFSGKALWKLEMLLWQTQRGGKNKICEHYLHPHLHGVLLSSSLLLILHQLQHPLLQLLFWHHCISKFTVQALDFIVFGHKLILHICSRNIRVLIQKSIFELWGK